MQTCRAQFRPFLVGHWNYPTDPTAYVYGIKDQSPTNTLGKGDLGMQPTKRSMSSVQNISGQLSCLSIWQVGRLRQSTGKGVLYQFPDQHYAAGLY